MNNLPDRDAELREIVSRCIRKYESVEFSSEIEKIAYLMNVITARETALLERVLELIGEEQKVPRPINEEARARFYRVSGQNFVKYDLRQKVSTLIEERK